MKANNVGDARRCKMGQDPKDIEKYCIMNFKDFDEIENCKTPDNFCHACCDNEFGAIKVA